MGGQQFVAPPCCACRDRGPGACCGNVLAPGGIARRLAQAARSLASGLAGCAGRPAAGRPQPIALGFAARLAKLGAPLGGGVRPRLAERPPAGPRASGLAGAPHRARAAPALRHSAHPHHRFGRCRQRLGLGEPRRTRRLGASFQHRDVATDGFGLERRRAPIGRCAGRTRRGASAE